ncbi:MAG: hypothetical protein LM563_00570 [Thermofilum sp.]|nr:hypothetical protein [Thermofilum sp.]
MLPLMLLILTLPALHPQPSQELAPNVLFASVEDGVLLFSGSARSGRLDFPLLGFSSGALSKAYILRVRGYLLSAAAHGESFFFVGTAYLDGLPAVLLVQLPSGGRPRVTVIYSEAPLYGVDLLPVNDTLYIAGYIYRYTPVVESDVIIVKYNYVTGRVEGSLAFGSVAFDDHPKRVLAGGNSILVIGDTYAYNVSQSDVLIAKVTPDLKLVESVAVGGAGRESAEDAAPMKNGSILVVGTTVGGTGTPDAFIVRVSDIGGLTYLSAAVGYENEYAAAVFKAENSYVVALYGRFEEDASFTLLVNYTLKDPWTLEPSTALIVNSSAGQVTPLRSRNTATAVKIGSCIAVLNPQEKAACLGEGATPLTVDLLDFKEQAPRILTGLYGWRPLWSVVKARECPSLQASDLQLQVEEIPISSVKLIINRQKYIKQIDPVREVIKFIERNMPLLLFTPMLAAAILVILETRKHGL